MKNNVFKTGKHIKLSISLKNLKTASYTYLVMYLRVTLISDFLEFPKSLGFLIEFWKIMFEKLVSDSKRHTVGRFKIY